MIMKQIIILCLTLICCGSTRAEWVTFVDLGSSVSLKTNIVFVGAGEVIDVVKKVSSTNAITKGPSFDLVKDGYRNALLVIETGSPNMTPKISYSVDVHGPATITVYGTPFACSSEAYGALSLWIRPDFTDFFFAEPRSCLKCPPLGSVESLLPDLSYWLLPNFGDNDYYKKGSFEVMR